MPKPEQKRPSLLEKQGLIWLDGQLIDWQEAKTHVLTHSLHYGVGVFEGVRAYQTEEGHAIFRLQDHTDRLFNSAKIMKISMPFDKKTLNQAQIDVVSKNDLSAAKAVYLRPMVFSGAESLGIHATNPTHVMVAAWEWGAYLGAEKMANGVNVGTSSYVRSHVNSTMCKAKTNGNYVNSVLAAREASDHGYDEALLLDHQGHVAEGSGENFFMVRKGKIYTPPTASILEGITRDTIMTLAREKGYELIEKNITRDEVYIADEAFFTGTAAELTPIRALDNREIGEGKPGPITQDLQSAYFDVVYGRSDKHKAWLTFVN